MNGSLFLAPENPDTGFSDTELLKQALTSIGLVQQSTSDTCFCGDSFAQLITFMGCSPHLVFEPPDDGSDNYCHVLFHRHEHIQLYTGQQTAPPRCPACRHRISDWKQYRQQWHENTASQTWQCPKCETLSYTWQLDWRQSGGAGKISIEIKNIFPGEAVPVDRLLLKLREISREEWRYFYIA